MSRKFSLPTIAATAVFFVLCHPAFAADLVISQVYGGGGNAGAQLKNDFNEVFNRGSAPIPLGGMSVQYASTTGNLGSSGSLTLLPGKPASEAVVLQAIRSLPTQTVRRWSTWTPWAVIGSGVVVGAVGVPFMLTAKSNVNAYDNWIAEACPAGCRTSAVPQDVTDARDRAKTDNIVGISFFAVGGVLAASGVTMLILNQPRIVQAPTSARLSATPVLGAGTLGLSVAVEQ